MQSKAKTVAAYLKELPPERRAVVNAVRDVINKNIHKDFEEGMGYGMMGWSVPHRVFPQGYHCDPSQPLPFAGVAAQKNAYSLYMCSCYYGDSGHEKQVRAAFAAIGKKPDMGKSCIRFKKLDDIPLQAIGKIIGSMTAQQFVKDYLQSREEYEATKTSKRPTQTSKRRNVKTSRVKKKMVAKKTGRK